MITKTRVSILLVFVTIVIAALTGTARADANLRLHPDSHRPHGVGVAGRTNADQALRRFWTAERMKNAPMYRPVTPPGAGRRNGGNGGLDRPDGPARAVRPAAPTATTMQQKTARPGFSWSGSLTTPPATTTGRVFFTLADGQPAWCSGSAVSSEGKDMVITAGHCVHDGAGGTWHGNWIFVPGYRNGSAPYGIWTARILDTTDSWYFHSDVRGDLGVAIVNPDSSGRHLVNVVGGQGFAWNYPVGLYAWDLGYPAESPYTGQTLQACTNSTWSDPWSTWGGILGLDCDFNGGASGGPWLIYFNGSLGYVNSVNSFTRSWLPGRIYGPYFDNEEGNLYNMYRYA